MKLTALIILLITSFVATAQMEFEEVFQVYPNGGYAQKTKVYFKKDTILVSTQSTHSGQEETNYFYSTDEGKNWTNLRDNFRISTPIEDKYDFLGVLHPLTFEFVKLDRVNDTTTFIYYMNLQGEILKKVSYPYASDHSGIKLNPIDLDFISLHRQIYYQYLDKYSHDLGYSTDRGDTWNYLKPEPELKKQRGIGLVNQRKIDFYFSSIEKGRMLIQFQWTQIGDPGYQLTTGFNYLTTQYKFSDYYFNLENLICFECFGEDKLTSLDFDEQELVSFDLHTGNKSTIVFKDRLPKLNSDSLKNEAKFINIFPSWGTKFSFLKSNLINDSHKIIYINIRTKFEPENSNRFNNINQLFFQTFDNGKTWEFIFNNEDIKNQVVDMFINYQNNDLWILKDTSETDRLVSSSWYPILYKSKSPLTSVENQKSNNFNVFYTERSINLISDTSYKGATINVYNLNGKLLITKFKDIILGENIININQPVYEKLILIQIRTNETQIFKLIRSD